MQNVNLDDLELEVDVVEERETYLDDNTRVRYSFTHLLHI